MNFIKNNKIFIVLFIAYAIMIVTLSYFLISGNKDPLVFWNNDDKYTENNIAYLNGVFNEERMSIDLNWNIELANGKIEKYEIYQNEVLLREGINASSAVLGMKTFDLSTGNNKFDLKVTLNDGSILSKSVYVYVDEVFDFEVRENIVGMSIRYNLTYTYDDRNPVSPPLIHVYESDQPISLNYIDASQVSKDGHYITMNAIYELNYENIETGHYVIDVNFEFVNYNLIFPKTSVIDVIGVDYED